MNPAGPRMCRPPRVVAILLWSVVGAAGLTGCVAAPPAPSSTPAELPVGMYYGHDSTLVVRPGGEAVWTFRPTMPCPAATRTDVCDDGVHETGRADLRVVPDGSGLSAVVEQTNDPDGTPLHAHIRAASPSPGS